jgi:murein L,D-transpeptidase YcbB/YkuD
MLVAGLSAPKAADEPAGLWIRDGRLTPQAEQLLGVMRSAEIFGLSSVDFAEAVSAIESRRVGPAIASAERTINAATSRLVHQLHDGRVDPRAAGYELTRRRATFDSDAALRQLAAARDVQTALAAFEPDTTQYRALKQTLAHYRRIPPELNLLPALPGRRLETGDRYAGTEKLRRLLTEFGDGPAGAEEAPMAGVYDDRLAAAVAGFQRRHGLTADGIIGSRTYAALTVPIARRIRQIELTMERWRWLPAIEAPAVIVNVPQYMLYTLPDPADRAAVPAKIPVIVGQSAKQTPIFDSAIEAVVFRPYWNVPRSIVLEEMLPLISRDPAYLAKHELEIVRGDGDDAQVLASDANAVSALRSGKARLRQRPGPTNALGLIKFVLPNPYSVYLHSTPEARLFARDRRALSHGCIRVSDASALAAYLLAGNGGNWDVAAVEAATCGSETFTVRLASPVPVFILYGTVVIDTEGDVLFFDDVYGYDRRLEKLLVARQSARKTAIAE